MLMAFGGNFSQRLDYPLLLGPDELMDLMLGDFYRRNNFDFTGRYDNSRLRGSLAAPNLVGKCWIRNDDSLCYLGAILST
ncbi:MAG: hypothetical protein Q8R54_03405 [Methylobacter sp.]|nr:hypothetical protein [Methylobacter sp.]